MTCQVLTSGEKKQGKKIAPANSSVIIYLALEIITVKVNNTKRINNNYNHSQNQIKYIKYIERNISILKSIEHWLVYVINHRLPPIL